MRKAKRKQTSYLVSRLISKGIKEYKHSEEQSKIKKEKNLIIKILRRLLSIR